MIIERCSARALSPRRIAVCGAALALLTLLGGLAPGASAAAPGAQNGRIAYSVGAVLPDPDPGGHSQVYTVLPDGTDGRQLTHVTAPVQAGDPAWSPDGQRIAYVSNASGLFQVWIMNADGSGQRRLVRDRVHDAFLPRWSPDGSQLLFTRCTTPFGALECTVATVGADGMQVRDRTGGHWVDQFGDWAPDGRSIVFSSDRGGLVSAIWRLTLSTGTLQRLTAPVPQAFWPSYRHDGKRILFGDNWERPGTSTYGMRANGSDVRLLIPAPGGGGNAEFARYSPDGRRIVFNNDRYPDEGVTVANADGTGAHDIVTTDDIVIADWGIHS